MIYTSGREQQGFNFISEVMAPVPAFHESLSDPTDKMTSAAGAGG
jgi:hypothetical protein